MVAQRRARPATLAMAAAAVDSSDANLGVARSAGPEMPVGPANPLNLIRLVPA